VKNGIWMCRDHGTAVDSTDSEFTVEQLREWKKKAEDESRRLVLGSGAALRQADVTDPQLAERIRAAARADLRIFRQTAKWPSTSVVLTLKVENFDGPVTTSALAGAAMSLDDLILVAPPGMGKTTTLFQIAEGVLANARGDAARRAAQRLGHGRRDNSRLYSQTSSVPWNLGRRLPQGRPAARRCATS